MKESSQLQHPDNNLLIRIHSEGISYVITDENDEVVLQQLINVPAGKLNEVQFFEHFFEQPELRVSDENVLNLNLGKTRKRNFFIICCRNGVLIWFLKCRNR